MRARASLFLFGGVALVCGALAWWLHDEGRTARPEAVGSFASEVQTAAAGREPGALPEVAPREPRALQAGAAPAEVGAAARSEGASAEAGQSAAAEPTATLALLVLHAHGAPAAGASVALARAETLLASGLTDVEGRVRLVAPPGEATLHVAGISDQPYSEVLHVDGNSESSERRVQLPAGQLVAGRVLVDGHPARTGFPIALRGADRKRSSSQPRLPEAIREVLSHRLPGVGESQRHGGGGGLFNAQLAGPAGEFLFSGLPLDWGGQFEVPSAFGCEDGDEALAVGAPVGDLVLRLRTLRGLHGRVVAAGGGQPVPGAGIDCKLMFGQGSRQDIFAADAEGRFAVPLEPMEGAFDRVELRLTHPLGSAFRALVVTAEQLQGGDDLGDIELYATRTIAFVALDSTGAPIAGALGVADDASHARSLPTDAEGRALLHGVPLDCPTISVWAHRYHVAQAALPEAGAASMTAPDDAGADGPAGDAPAAGPSDSAGADGPAGDADADADTPPPLVVVLQRSASLDVRVRGVVGPPPAGLELRLEASTPIFSSHNPDVGHGMRTFQPHPMVHEVGMTRLGSSWSETSSDGMQTTVKGSIGFEIEGEAPIAIADLLAGVPFDLVVRDKAGSAAWGPQTIVLAPEEARELTVVIEREPVDLVVHVTDPQGQPLHRAHVEPLWPGKNGHTSHGTNEQGFVTLRSLYADEVGLLVRMSGHVEQLLERVYVQRDGRPIEVVLPPGRCVNVFVHDEHGSPVEARSVSAVLDGRELGTSMPVKRATEPAPGAAVLSGTPRRQPALDRSRWTLDELPDAEVVLVIQVGERVIEQAHDTQLAEADVLVDPGG